MNRGANQYDWAAYYAEAYEKERKQNIVLAERVADAERRQADLRDNLDRICATPFWKMTVPFRRLQERIRQREQQNKDLDRSSKEDACLVRYTKELQRQKQSYQEWLRKNNNESYEEGMTTEGEKVLSVAGWEAVRVPESDIVLLTYGGGLLAWNIFEKIKSYFNNNKTCVIAYTDEDFYWEDLSQRMEPWFKPCYSPDTLLSYNYWGHLVAVRESLLTEVLKEEGGRSFLSENGEEPESVRQAVRFYHLCLYLEESVLRDCQFCTKSVADCICHIPQVLFHRPYEPDDKAGEAIDECRTKEEKYIKARQCLVEELEAGRHLTGAGAEYAAVREAALYRRGCKASLQCGPEPEIYHVVYDTAISGRERCARAQRLGRNIHPHPFVSVVIPSKDHPEVLEQCLQSFRKRTSYDCYEWIVVDNGSSMENRSKIEKLQREYGFSYLYEEMPFNFSKMCNKGVAQAQGDLILLLNDDIEIIEKSWLGRMVGQAVQPHVGAVGAKLWYAHTRQIQHAGVTNLRIGPSHKLVTFQDDRDYYYGHNRVTYDMAGVTAACLMVTKAKYEAVGGFDETMAVSYNDVEFCFKLMEAGYYNVLRNDVVLYHHESLSRGLDEQDEGKWERLLREKQNLYARHPQMDGKDPFYHENLIDNASDYRCNYKFAYEDPLYTVHPQPLQGEEIMRTKEEGLRLIVDRAEAQHKIYEEEPDIFWIMGWCYVTEEDNAFYDKKILLQRGEGTGYSAVPSDWNRKDVEESLRGETHIGLAGFVLRILKQDLEAGTYRIGMLCTDQVSGEKKLAWSDKEITVVT